MVHPAGFAQHHRTRLRSPRCVARSPRGVQVHRCRFVAVVLDLVDTTSGTSSTSRGRAARHPRPPGSRCGGGPVAVATGLPARVAASPGSRIAGSWPFSLARRKMGCSGSVPQVNLPPKEEAFTAVSMPEEPLTVDKPPVLATNDTAAAPARTRKMSVEAELDAIDDDVRDTISGLSVCIPQTRRTRPTSFAAGR